MAVRTLSPNPLANDGGFKTTGSREMRVVPPRPETIRQAIIYGRRYGRMTVDRFTKQNTPPTLREMNYIKIIQVAR